MIYNSIFYPFFGVPPIPPICDKPPTVYSILESIVNYDEPEQKKIKDLAKYGRTTIFDFDYPLSEKVPRETFECMILNHFLMRRIGFETVRAFQIHLNVKLNSIMPMYNRMFDLLYDKEMFLGDIQTKEGFDNEEGEKNSQSSNSLINNAENKTDNTSDRRFSDTPQNQLSNVKDGKYISEYNLDSNNVNSKDFSTSEGSGSSNENDKRYKNYKETIKNINMLDSMIKINQEKTDIYNMIFKDLEELFYQLI